MATPEGHAATARELIQRVLNEGDIGFAEKTLSESGHKGPRPSERLADGVARGEVGVSLPRLDGSALSTCGANSVGR